MLISSPPRQPHQEWSREKMGEGQRKAKADFGGSLRRAERAVSPHMKKRDMDGDLVRTLFCERTVGSMSVQEVTACRQT